jgi:hypothetical protein
MTRPTRAVPGPLAATLSLVLAVLGLTALAPVATAAQDLRYLTVSRAEFAGMMGTMMRMAGEGNEADTTTTWMKGSLLRTDDADGTSSIMDLSTMTMTMVDHGAETYWTTSFEEMVASAEAAMAEADAQMEEQAREGEEVPEIQYSLDVDRTGERREINGFDAEQVIMTMRIEPDPEAAEDADAAAAMEGAGQMMWVTELWLSTEVPTWERMRDAVGDDLERFRDPAGSDASGMMTGSPRMRAAMQEMGEQMEGLEGESVRTVMFMVLVPTGSDFDRDAVMAMADEPLPEGPSLSDLMGQAMAESAKESAASAVKRRLGGLGGLFGGGGDDEEEEEEEAPPAASQVILMKMINEIVDVQEATLDAADFVPPATYTEVSGPMGG